MNDYLEKIINNKVINSSEVSKFDNNGQAIVLGLFKAYYNNPKLLDKTTLNRIYFDIRKLNFTDNIIDFNNGDIKLVKNELDAIKNNLLYKNIFYIFKKMECENLENMDLIITKIKENYDEEKQKKYIENIEYLLKHKILVRNIADYISNMTDNFAINEYNSIVHKNI